MNTSFRIVITVKGGGCTILAITTPEAVHGDARCAERRRNDLLLRILRLRDCRIFILAIERGRKGLLLMLTTTIKRRGETWVSRDGEHVGCWLGEHEVVKDLVELSNQAEERELARKGKAPRQLEIPATPLPLDVPEAQKVIDAYGEEATE